MAMTCTHEYHKEKGTYDVHFLDMNITQAMEAIHFAEDLEKTTAPCQQNLPVTDEESENYEVPWGTLDIVPCGKMKGLTLDAVLHEGSGVSGLMQILETHYLFGQEKIFRGASPYAVLDLINHEVLWLIQDEKSFFKMRDFLNDAVKRYLPDYDVKKGLSDLEKEQLTEKARTAFEEKMIQIVPIISDDIKILMDDYTIPYGDYEGLTFRRLYEEKSLYALVHMMLTAEKGTLLFTKCKTHIAYLLKYAINIIPYEDFISAFSRFFRLNDTQVLEAIQQPDDVKEKDYEDKVQDLLKRISA